MTAFDLIISGGTLIDPAQGIHDRRDIAFTNGHVAAVAPRIPCEQAPRSINATGKYVVPGLVDAHVHVFEGSRITASTRTRPASRMGQQPWSMPVRPVRIRSMAFAST